MISHSNDIIGCTVGICMIFLGIRLFKGKSFKSDWKLENLWDDSIKGTDGIYYISYSIKDIAMAANVDPGVVIEEKVVNHTSTHEQDVLKIMFQLNETFAKAGIKIAFYQSYGGNASCIDIVFVEKFLEKKIGSTESYAGDGKIKRAVIKLVDIREDYNLILCHELFHALGISGHLGGRRKMMNPEPMVAFPTQEDLKMLEAYK